MRGAEPLSQDMVSRIKLKEDNMSKFEVRIANSKIQNLNFSIIDYLVDNGFILGQPHFQWYDPTTE